MGGRTPDHIALDNLLATRGDTPGKTAEPHIQFGLTKKNGKKIYHVRDNGVGFDMKYADKLFGSFQCAGQSERIEGTGIGLATVARIISRHGGSYGQKAWSGTGQRFILPWAKKNLLNVIIAV